MTTRKDWPRLAMLLFTTSDRLHLWRGCFGLATIWVWLHFVLGREGYATSLEESLRNNHLFFVLLLGEFRGVGCCDTIEMKTIKFQQQMISSEVKQ